MVPWLVIQLDNVIDTCWLGPRRLYQAQENFDLMLGKLNTGYSFMDCIKCNNMPSLCGLHVNGIYFMKSIKISKCTIFFTMTEYSNPFFLFL